MSQEKYDGALISELGVQRYLKATKDIKVSNENEEKGIRILQYSDFQFCNKDNEILQHFLTKGKIRS